ncbi:DUF3558 domain-containing protein [Gordonia shandongensis]|uniref:DUF3558 domain-containing protein n=1 Tax=Gordonia shandongensis TaxID=376351 RepID=UPI001FDEE3BD|nr:DUF3558 domain-containing protein [Gordonia shandongensis]
MNTGSEIAARGLAGRGRRVLLAVAAALAIAVIASACTVDGQAVREGRVPGGTTGEVDTDQFENHLLECEVVSPGQVAKAVGGSLARRTFSGAICRWIVSPGDVDVTFNWFEWGDYNLEKETAQKLGFTTENVTVRSQSAFTQRDPARPNVCAVTAKSPRGGIYTWWVEPSGDAAGGDPCAAPTTLMELVLTGAY